MTTNPRELLIARSAADVIVNSGYFKEGFSMQTGTGGASLVQPVSWKTKCVAAIFAPTSPLAVLPRRWFNAWTKKV
ncbi:citrate lyase subunit alpha [Escherichia coli]